MGTMNHNAVIATTWDANELIRVKAWIDSLGADSGSLFVIGPPMMNRETTVVMLPDGSKEGWAESDAGNEIRQDFINEIKKSDYDDGSSPWKFVEIGYGEYGQKVLAGNCKNCFSDSEYAE